MAVFWVFFFVKSHFVILNDVVMRVLFVCLSASCHRALVVKQVAGFIGLVFPDYQREKVLVNESVAFCFVVCFKVVDH